MASGLLGGQQRHKGPRWPGPSSADLLCGMFFEIDSYSLLELF